MTTYRIDVDCEDVGEYDAVFMAELAQEVARVVGNTGTVGFVLSVQRIRPDDPPPYIPVGLPDEAFA